MRMRIEHAVSAGGIVYRVSNDKIQLLLCGRNETGVWGLPKGTPDAGESLESTARREVKEETGLGVEIVGRVGSIHYWFAHAFEKVRYHKIVQHYLMVPVDGSIDLHDQEYDRVEWFDHSQAYALLTYKNEAEIVRRAATLIMAKSHSK